MIGAVVFVQQDVKESLVVLRPLCAGVVIDASEDALDPIGMQPAAGNVLDIDGVDFSAFEVDRVGEFGLVGADAERADAAKFMPFGKKIYIELNYLVRAGRFLLAAIDGVLLSRFGARVIQVFFEFFRSAGILLLDAPLHFLKQFFLKRFDVAQCPLEVFVFRLQITQGFGIFATAHPVVFVVACDAVLGDLVFAFGRNWI